jgi:NitT/TauT family transport system substrate-binding protein
LVGIIQRRVKGDKLNRRIGILLGFLVCIAVVALVVLVRPRPVTVGLQLGTVNYPMMHAVKGGFFEKEGVVPEVSVFQSANDALDAVLGGSVFIDAVIPIQNIANLQRKKPGVLGIVALLISDKDHPLDYLVVPAQSEITTPAQLSGKTIVVFPGSYSETITRLTFEKLGIKDVKFLKRGPADMPQAIQSGEADAGIFYDPVATLAVKQGWGRIIEKGFWENNLLPEIVVGGYTYNVEYAKRNPSVAEKCLKGLQNAIIDARENPVEAKRSAVFHLKQFESVLGSIPDSRVELADEVNPELIDKTLRLYVDNGLLEDFVDLRPLLK